MEETKEKKLDSLFNKKMLLVSIVSILVIIAIIATVYIFYNKSNAKFKVNFQGESNKIKYSAKMQEDSEVLIVMKNETGKTLSGLEYIVTYYDSEGKELSKRIKSMDTLLKKGEITLNSANSAIVETEKIKDYKIEINPKFYDGEDKKSNYEKIKISEAQEQGDNIIVNVKNTTDEDVIHAVLYAAFFKDGKPVKFYANDVYNLSGEEKLTFGKPTGVEYDFYEIYIKD